MRGMLICKACKKIFNVRHAAFAFDFEVQPEIKKEMVCPFCHKPDIEAYHEK
ncbi:MAG: hypothetical protein ACFFCS_08715 [Candidatus Hodarchaeota archaeon]